MAILIGLLQLLMAFIIVRCAYSICGKGIVQFNRVVYACSPEDSSFKAVFTEMEITECQWLAHDGQAPDGNVSE